MVKGEGIMKLLVLEIQITIHLWKIFIEFIYILCAGTQRSSLVSISHMLSSDDEYYESYPIIGLYDRPLPFCGCGIGWFS